MCISASQQNTCAFLLLSMLLHISRFDPAGLLLHMVWQSIGQCHVHFAGLLGGI